MTEIQIRGTIKETLIVKEAFQTVKRRLLDSTQFIEVHSAGRPILYNKMDIARIAVSIPQVEEKMKKKK